MRKIKILYGLEAAGGGALKHLVYLVTRLNPVRFEISVILSNNRRNNIEDEINRLKLIGVEVIILPITRNINPVKDVAAFFKIVSFLKKNKFDIVHAHSSKAGGLFRIAAWFCNIKSIIYTPHCFYFQGKKGLKKNLFICLERLLSIITSKIVVSDSEKKEIIEHKICAKDKIVNINNAIDFDDYQQIKDIDEVKEFYGIDRNAFIVGAIGRLTKQKDWTTFIYAANEVLKYYPQTIFLLVGNGELYEEIQGLIKKLGREEKIILTGYIKEIHKIYSIIDVLVNTSMWEGLPYVFLEAMKFKKPIIATDSGNLNMIIDEEIGYLAKVKDFYFIAKKIMSLIEDRKLLMKMGENGIRILHRKYSFEFFVNEHEKLYLQESGTKNFE